MKKEYKLQVGDSTKLVNTEMDKAQFGENLDRSRRAGGREAEMTSSLACQIKSNLDKLCLRLSQFLLGIYKVHLAE